MATAVMQTVAWIAEAGGLSNPVAGVSVLAVTVAVGAAVRVGYKKVKVHFEAPERPSPDGRLSPVRPTPRIR